MHSLLLAAALALVAPLDESTPALQARVLSGLDRPQAVADLYRLYERREERGDQSALLLTLEKASRSPKARTDVRALAAEMLGELAITRGQLAHATALFDGVAPIRTWIRRGAALLRGTRQYDGSLQIRQSFRWRAL